MKNLKENIELYYKTPSAHTFQEILRFSLELIPKEDFSKKFDVDEHTLQRWTQGSAQPLPRFKNLIVDFIYERTKT